MLYLTHLEGLATTDVATLTHVSGLECILSIIDLVLESVFLLFCLLMLLRDALQSLCKLQVVISELLVDGSLVL